MKTISSNGFMPGFRTVVGVIAMALCASVALAHSGGTNKCGGHNDKKRGGYHVHNMAKHCSCHPEKSECKTGDGPAAKTEKKVKKKETGK